MPGGQQLAKKPAPAAALQAKRKRGQDQQPEEAAEEDAAEQAGRVLERQLLSELHCVSEEPIPVGDAPGYTEDWQLLDPMRVREAREK